MEEELLRFIKDGRIVACEVYELERHHSNERFYTDKDKLFLIKMAQSIEDYYRENNIKSDMYAFREKIENGEIKPTKTKKQQTPSIFDYDSMPPPVSEPPSNFHPRDPDLPQFTSEEGKGINDWLIKETAKREKESSKEQLSNREYLRAERVRLANMMDAYEEKGEFPMPNFFVSRGGSFYYSEALDFKIPFGNTLNFHAFFTFLIRNKHEEVETVDFLLNYYFDLYESDFLEFLRKNLIVYKDYYLSEGTVVYLKTWLKSKKKTTKKKAENYTSKGLYEDLEHFIGKYFEPQSENFNSENLQIFLNWFDLKRSEIPRTNYVNSHGLNSRQTSLLLHCLLKGFVTNYSSKKESKFFIQFLHLLDATEFKSENNSKFRGKIVSGEGFSNEDWKKIKRKDIDKIKQLLKRVKLNNLIIELENDFLEKKNISF